MNCDWFQPILLVERLTDIEQSQVETWLTVTGLTVGVLMLLLLAFTVSLRTIAMRTTRPCRWCMEFIPRAATQCPRCGKQLPSDKNAENIKPG